MKTQIICNFPSYLPQACWLLTVSSQVHCRFLDPVILGKYPEEMHEILGPDLPIFSESDMKMLKWGLDFIGINHYTSFYVKDCIFSLCEQGPSRTEGYIQKTALKDGVFIGKPVCMLSLPHCHKFMPEELVNGRC